MLNFRFVKDILQILKEEDKKKFTLIILLMIVNTLFEVFGLGLIIPLISIVTNENFIFENKYIYFIYSQLNFNETSSFILFFCFLILFFFLIKTIILLFITYKLIRFSNYLNYNLTTRLFSIYLNQPFVFFLKINSSELLRNLRDEIGRCVKGVIHSSAEIISDSLLLISIIVFLFLIEPFATIFALVFFSSIGLLYYFATKNILFNWGEKKLILESKRYKNVIQSFNGIKEIILSHTQEDFSNNYKVNSKESIYIDGNSDFISKIPRNLFELLTILVFVLIMSNFILNEKKIEESLVILGLFGFAAFKILPSANKILNSFQLIKYHLPSFYLIKKEINREPQSNHKNNNQDMEFSKNIRIKNLFFKYENTNKFILENINLDIEKNSMIGIIGQSGSGKSTLINLICGLILPSKGEILIDDKKEILNSNRWHSKIGIIPQEIFLFDDTIKKNIAFNMNDELIDEERLNLAIKYSNLTNFINDLDQKENTLVGERGLRISGGQKQRIGIARLIYRNSDLIILDEATSNLDNETEKSIMDSIKNFKGKKTIIIITHKRNTLENCDKVFSLKNKNLTLIENGSK